jgi:predicted RNA binding protein YcfA (HicA-like mRNA interferase family)
VPIVSGPEAVKAFERAGFVFQRQSGSHVILFHAGRGATIAVPVHGGKDVKPETLRKIIKDAGMTVEEFVELLRRK